MSLTFSQPETLTQKAGISVFALIAMTDAADQNVRDRVCEIGSPSTLSRLLLDILEYSEFAGDYFKKITEDASSLVHDIVQEHNQDPERYRKRMKDSKDVTAILQRCLEKLKKHAYDNLLFCPGDTFSDSPETEKAELQAYVELLRQTRVAFNTAFGYNTNPNHGARVVIFGSHNIVNDCLNESRHVNIDAFNIEMLSSSHSRDNSDVDALREGTSPQVAPRVKRGSSSPPFTLTEAVSPDAPHVFPGHNNPFVVSTHSPSALRASRSSPSFSSSAGHILTPENKPRTSSILVTAAPNGFSGVSLLDRTKPDNTNDSPLSPSSVDSLPLYSSDITSPELETTPSLPRYNDNLGDVRPDASLHDVLLTSNPYDAGASVVSSQSPHVSPATAIYASPAQPLGVMSSSSPIPFNPVDIVSDSRGNQPVVTTSPVPEFSPDETCGYFENLGSDYVDIQRPTGIRNRVAASFYSFVSQIKGRFRSTGARS